VAAQKPSGYDRVIIAGWIDAAGVEHQLKANDSKGLATRLPVEVSEPRYAEESGMGTVSSVVGLWRRFERQLSGRALLSQQSLGLALPRGCLTASGQ
jgi:hypothetical protein